MAADLHRAFALNRHVAIGACDAGARVYALIVHQALPEKSVD